MVAGSRRAARSRGRRRGRDPRRGAWHRGCPGRSGRDGRLHGSQHDDRARSDYDRAETIEETAELVTQPRRHRHRDRSRPSRSRPGESSRRADPDATTATSTCSSTTSGAASCSRAARRSGTLPSGSTTSTTGLRILRLAIDTHLITSHHLLPLLIDKPGGLLVEVTDGTADYNASRYRISVFYDLAKVAVNRLAFSQGHELEPHGATAVAITPGWLRSEMMLDNFGVSEENWRDASIATLTPAPRASRLRALRVASLRRARGRRAGSGSRSGPMEPEIGQLRSARARVRLHRRRRLAARRLAIHRRSVTARHRGRSSGQLRRLRGRRCTGSDPRRGCARS